MRLRRPGPSIAAGVALLGSLVSAAQAGHLFDRCHRDSCDTTVKLPAQRVVVETAAPRVVVQETTQVSRSLAAPVIGTVYMPMAFPVAGVGLGAGVPQRDLDVTCDDHNPLR